MDPGPLLDRVLDDEGLTAGLDEADAALVVRTLGDRVRQIAARTQDVATARNQVDALCRQARTIIITVQSDPRKSAAELRRQLAELAARPH